MTILKVVHFASQTGFSSLLDSLGHIPPRNPNIKCFSAPDAVAVLHLTHETVIFDLPAIYKALASLLSPA